MKRKVFGILIMIVGCAMIAVGTAFFAEAAVEEAPAGRNDASEEKVAEGDYVSDTGAVISVCGGKIVIDGVSEEYSLSVWRNLPVTDEDTGKITYVNYYYIRTSGAQYTYDPSGGIITAAQTAYKL